MPLPIKGAKEIIGIVSDWLERLSRERQVRVEEHSRPKMICPIAYVFPELNELISKLKTSHDKMLDAKREDLLEIIRQCMKEIHNLAGDNSAARNVSNVADSFFTQKKQQIDLLHIMDMDQILHLL